MNNENTAVNGSTGNLVSGYPSIDFQSLSKKRVFLENDANAAAWAEYRIGASKGTNVSVMITLGTGVGGGIIVNNKLLKGKSGAAGEMHFKMYPDKRRKCTCGSWDCFEAYASGTALKVDAEEMLNNPKVTTYDVMDGVKNGDKKMTEIFNRWINDITNIELHINAHKIPIIISDKFSNIGIKYNFNAIVQSNTGIIIINTHNSIINISRIIHATHPINDNIFCNAPFNRSDTEINIIVNAKEINIGINSLTIIGIYVSIIKSN